MEWLEGLICGWGLGIATYSLFVRPHHAPTPTKDQQGENQ